MSGFGEGDDDITVNVNIPEYINADTLNVTSTSYITTFIASNIGENGENPQPNDSLTLGGNPPPGGWEITPAEIIPCRGYQAVTCSLIARMKQFKSHTGGGGGSNFVKFMLNSDIDLLNDANSVPDLFTNTPGPFKMSDFIDAERFGWESQELSVTFGNTTTITSYRTVSHGYQIPNYGSIYLGPDNSLGDPTQNDTGDDTGL